MTVPRKQRVIFVCIGNSCRSPMAEAIARRDAPDLWDVLSGGLTPLGELQPLTVETIEKNQYSAAGLTSKAILHADWEAADLIINMSGLEKERVFEDYAKVEDWPVSDPYGADPDVYQATFDDIRNRIYLLADRLRRSADGQEASKT
jgi:protein-tyrosine-phosphatase